MSSSSVDWSAVVRAQQRGEELALILAEQLSVPRNQALWYLEAHRSELLAAKAQQEAVETAARRQRAAEWRETYARRAAETRTARLSEPRRGEDVVGVAYGGGAAGGTSSRAGDGEASTWSRVLTLVDAPERARTSQHGHTHQHESRARHHYATLAKLAGAGGAGAPAS